jgi:hypothetical protein
MSAELMMVNEAMAEAISCEPAPIASLLCASMTSSQAGARLHLRSPHPASHWFLAALSFWGYSAAGVQP